MLDGCFLLDSLLHDFLPLRTGVCGAERPRSVSRGTRLTLCVRVYVVRFDGKIHFLSRQKVKFGFITPENTQFRRHFHTKTPCLGGFGPSPSLRKRGENGQEWVKNRGKRDKIERKIEPKMAPYPEKNHIFEFLILENTRGRFLLPGPRSSWARKKRKHTRKTTCTIHTWCDEIGSRTGVVGLKLGQKRRIWSNTGIKTGKNPDRLETIHRFFVRSEVTLGPQRRRVLESKWGVNGGEKQGIRGGKIPSS